MLPTHNRSGPSRPGATAKLQGAFDAGMSMAGLKSTKAGAGDKEKAYVVRQNWLLKTVLVLVALFSCGTVVVFSTVLKVSVTRRDAIKAENVHHKLEHQAQLKLIRAHMELQKALEQEVHETSRLEEFRSVADKAIGDHAARVKASLKSKGVEAAILSEIEQADDKLRELLDAKMHSVLQHFHGVAVSARNSLRKVAQAIVNDVELDKRETDRFREKMQNQFGVKVDSDFDRIEALKRPAKDEDEYDLFKGQDNPDAPEHEEQPDEGEKEIVANLEKFFAKLKAHSFPVLEKSVIQDWEKEMAELNKVLNDESKELDLESVKNNLNSKIALAAPSVEKFDPAKHHSVVDYFEMRIEEAKLAAYRQELMDLYDGWKSDGKISPYTVLSGLEHLAEKNNMYLLYEWLDGAEADQDAEAEGGAGNPAA